MERGNLEMIKGSGVMENGKKEGELNGPNLS